MSADTFEEEYYLLYPSDISEYPLIYEDCNRTECPYKENPMCEDREDCPTYFAQKSKINNPAPLVMDFFTDITKKEAVYADCYFPFTLSGGSFAVSDKLYNILSGLGLEGIQFFPVTLLENNEEKYSGFRYVHIYNILPVLDEKNSKYQQIGTTKNSNNLLEIKFKTNTLKNIPLEKRLVFKFPLKRSYFIFHNSVTGKIMSVNPSGLQFVKISEYSLPNSDKIFV